MQDLPVEVSNCLCAVQKNIRYTGGVKEANEATLRLVYGNADLYIKQVHVQVRRRVVKVLDDDVDDDDFHQGISERSIADYICYSVRGDKRIVAVIIETKRTFSLHALAQLLGYYYRVSTNLSKPGICVLVTRQALHVMLFPFYSTEGNLVNTICLEEISLENFNIACELLPTLTTTVFNSYNPIMLIPRFLPLQKSFQYHIECDQDLRMRRLEEIIMQLQQKVIAGEKEIAKLKCKYVSVSVVWCHRLTSIEFDV